MEQLFTLAGVALGSSGLSAIVVGDPQSPLGQEKEFVRETGCACGSTKGIDDRSGTISRLLLHP